jgi:hypothetical protein
MAGELTHEQRLLRIYAMEKALEQKTAGSEDSSASSSAAFEERLQRQARLRRKRNLAALEELGPEVRAAITLGAIEASKNLRDGGG